MRKVTISTFQVSEETIESSFKKFKGNQKISVCVPCRNEEFSIGGIISSLKKELLANEYIDEIIVIDDSSTDSTSTIARKAGAKVIPIEEINSIYGQGRGKGNALWASLIVSEGEIVVWVDGDLRNFQPIWVQQLAFPLLENDSIHLVKADYKRSEESGGGGRNTELVAKPLLSMHFPALSNIKQPLAGEYAVRRSAISEINLMQGWGVEIGMLIDFERHFGAQSIAQSDLGKREHRHRSLKDLSVQSAEILATVHKRIDATRNLNGLNLTFTNSENASIELNLDERISINDLEIRLSTELKTGSK